MVWSIEADDSLLPTHDCRLTLRMKPKALHWSNQREHGLMTTVIFPSTLSEAGDPPFLN